MQKHVRLHYSYLAIHCGFCGQKIIPSEDEEKFEISPCAHTYLVAHSEGIEHLDERAQQQLNDNSYKIMINSSSITVFDKNNNEIDAESISDLLNFQESLIIESVTGAPSGMVLYVGTAPLDVE
jgi:hypothetical protein